MKSMGRGLVTVAALLSVMAQAQDCREQLPQILASAYGAAPPVALEQVICKVWPARSELTLVAVPLPAADCWYLAEQLRQRIGQIDKPRMTISIGVAGRSAADDGLGQLIHRADMAMYQAKRQGRNQTILAAEPLNLEEPEALASSVA